jgi:cytochrome c
MQNVLIGALALATAAVAQWQYPGCDDVTNTGFKYETLVQRGQASDPALDEPLKMAFDMDASGVVDVYYVERKGKAKVFKGASGTSAVIGTFEVAGATGVREEGLLGVALDPAFKSNRWIYFFYTPSSPSVYRLSRFTLAGPSLDMASEKILMQFPHDKGGCCHNGGAMTFDAYGDLWVSTGGNGSNQGGPINENNVSYSEEDGSSNTADLRGGVLRIHPDDSPMGYSIPKGNFGDWFASKTADPALAAQYRDTALVKPELFIKGSRNPYTMTVDPVRRWVMTGDVGPDNGAQMEEHNLYKTPAFGGWPYFAGKNLAYQGGKNAAAPSNTSKWNKGMKILPPATPSIRSYGTATAITGPIYRYDGDLASKVKLPPHFQRKWFIAEFEQNWIRMVTLDDAGEKILKEEPIFQNRTWSNPIALEQGPDGALYVINYSGYFNATSGTSIVRISYTGDCRPALPKLEAPLPNPISLFRPGQGLRAWRGSGTETSTLGPDRMLRLPAGTAAFELFDLSGKKVWSSNVAQGPEWILVRVPEAVGQGVFHVRLLPHSNASLPGDRHE